jgi:tetraacyldisaccharide 4'-kinase
VTASFHRAFLETISGNRRGPAASAARWVLHAAEPGFAVAAGLRGAMYDRQIFRSHAAPRPVVSVGNITTGGTGKTPIVQWLARALAQRGKRPAVLLRGYKSTAAGSDEAELLRQRLAPAPGPAAISIPVVAQADRVAAAQSLAHRKPEIDLFILDDGYQHRRLRRDFDLVLIDATEPFGFGHLLPRGLLRETPRALARSDAILITRSDQVTPENLAALKQRIQQFAPQIPLYCSEFAPDGWIGPNESPGQSSPTAPTGLCLAICGIGNPGAFAQSARRAGANVVKLIALDDHHHYTADDVHRLSAESRAINATALVTTEKDHVKLYPLLTQMRRAAAFDLPPCWALQIIARFADGAEATLLEQILAATATPSGSDRPDLSG